MIKSIKAYHDGTDLLTYLTTIVEITDYYSRLNTSGIQFSGILDIHAASRQLDDC